MMVVSDVAKLIELPSNRNPKTIAVKTDEHSRKLIAILFIFLPSNHATPYV